MRSQNFISPFLLAGMQFQDDSEKVGQKSYGYSMNDAGRGAPISFSVILLYIMQSQNFISPFLLAGMQFQDDSAKVGQKAYGYSMNHAGPGAPISMEPAREHGLSDIGSRSSAEAYRCQHEIIVTVCISNPSLLIITIIFSVKIITVLVCIPGFLS